MSDFTSLALVPTSAIIIKSLNIDSCQCTADIFGECSLNRAAAAAAVGGEVDRGLQQRQTVACVKQLVSVSPQQRSSPGGITQLPVPVL